MFFHRSIEFLFQRDDFAFLQLQQFVEILKRSRTVRDEGEKSSVLRFSSPRRTNLDENPIIRVRAAEFAVADRNDRISAVRIRRDFEFLHFSI